MVQKGRSWERRLEKNPSTDDLRPQCWANVANQNVNIPSPWHTELYHDLWNSVLKGYGEYFERSFSSYDHASTDWWTSGDMYHRRTACARRAMDTVHPVYTSKSVISGEYCAGKKNQERSSDWHPKSTVITGACDNLRITSLAL